MKNKVLIILSLFFSIIFLGLFVLINSAGNITTVTETTGKGGAR